MSKIVLYLLMMFCLQGVPYAVSQATSSQEGFNVPNHGRVSLATSSTDVLTTGYARIQGANRDVSVSTLGLPKGLAVISNRPGGVLVSETAVPSMPLISSGRTYVQTGNGTTTGIAIVNPNNQAITVHFYFTDVSGNNFGAGALNIEANHQIAAFLHEHPFNGPAVARGTFTFTSSLLVSAIAIQGFTNQRGEFLMTTLPVVSVSKFPINNQTIPQFANGGGWTTSIVLVNSGDVPVSGQLRLFRTDGQPLTMSFEGFENSVVDYQVAPRSARVFESTGQSSGVQVGSLTVTPAASQNAPQAFAIFRYSQTGVTTTQASVLGVEEAHSWSMIADAQGDSGTAGSIQSGVAVANPTDQHVDFRFELFGADGTILWLGAPVSLPPRGQLSLFLREIPGLPALSPTFNGVLRVFATGNRFFGRGTVVTGLRGRQNERGEFLITATFPINEVYAETSTEVLLPHFAIGAGYQTQFTLFSDNGANGTVYFYSPSGTPLSLTASANSR